MPEFRKVPRLQSLGLVGPSGEVVDMPKCPLCGIPTLPVWAIPSMFQCLCGFHGLVDLRAMTVDDAATLLQIWCDVDGDMPFAH